MLRKNCNNLLKSKILLENVKLNGAEFTLDVFTQTE